MIRSGINLIARTSREPPLIGGCPRQRLHVWVLSFSGSMRAGKRGVRSQGGWQNRSANSSAVLSVEREAAVKGGGLLQGFPRQFRPSWKHPSEGPSRSRLPKADKAAMHWQHFLANRKRLGGSSATHQGAECRDELPQPRQYP